MRLFIQREADSSQAGFLHPTAGGWMVDSEPRYETHSAAWTALHARVGMPGGSGLA